MEAQPRRKHNLPAYFDQLLQSTRHEVVSIFSRPCRTGHAGTAYAYFAGTVVRSDDVALV